MKKIIRFLIGSLLFTWVSFAVNYLPDGTPYENVTWWIVKHYVINGYESWDYGPDRDKVTYLNSVQCRQQNGRITYAPDDPMIFGVNCEPWEKQLGYMTFQYEKYFEPHVCCQRPNPPKKRRLTIPPRVYFNGLYYISD